MPDTSEGKTILRAGPAAFSLVELMAAMSVLALVLIVTFSVINQTSHLWKKTSGKIAAFQEARAGFEALTRKLSQATLNTYWDYDPPISAGTPTKYVRQSDLQFICGRSSVILATSNLGSVPGHAVFFQAPLGYNSDSHTAPGRLGNLLNTCGYFTRYMGDSASWPNFIRKRGVIREQNRYRLMELREQSNAMGAYSIDRNAALSLPSQCQWFLDPLSADPSRGRPLCENILTLVCIPRNSEDPESTSSICTPEYLYNTTQYISLPGDPQAELSRNQLPPLVQIAMVAIDEPSALLLDARFGSSAPVLQPDRLFTDLDKYESEMYASEGATPENNMECFLQAQKLNYRIFTSAVSIRQAKWSPTE